VIALRGDIDALPITEATGLEFASYGIAPDAFCAAHGVSVILAAPYNTGILATGAIAGARYYYQPAPPEIVERTHRLERACARHAVPLAAAALQFPLFHPAVASVVVGHERTDEVGRNLALLRHAIPVALWAELKEQRLIPEDAPVPV
jgi:D-threo-aldose 1-dehydrogenase